ncbi:hypothetical protein HJC23_010358 [Cyclotella cryptica]|uniref:HMG box domain-containing protein n=1 Tax=Cyclotella cryptica TaxID=29204 RepID=A0ABD3NCY3_9STRA|eukprot:CCRYP_021238-RA/>CCRYP_021238-RA protein AED:0.02 eAED:0.02 QI:233/-1/1/1/-1/1/1/103/353
MNAIVVTSLPSSDISVVDVCANESSTKPSFNIAKQSCNSINRVPVPTGLHINFPKKPMRPLTAYHIFFQIEREFIIQSMPDGEGDTVQRTSTRDARSTLQNVPNRYKSIKLSPDWYFGPGKRPKRKHRKAHGKIGFMDLSRIIASRWAELESIDPEVKTFVQKLAKQELDEYLADMKKYKELTKGLKPVISGASGPSPVSTPESIDIQANEYTFRVNSDKRHLTQNQHTIQRRPDAALSMQHSFQPAPIDLRDEIDYFISRIDNGARQLLPALRHDSNDEHTMNVPYASHHRERRNSLLSFLEPLFDSIELEQDSVVVQAQPSKKQRRNSPSTVTVDICDNEIIRMWKENNST